MQNAIQNLRASLQAYEPREAQSIIDLLLEEVCHITRIDRIMHPDRVITDMQREQLAVCAEQLRQGVPVQQALGYEWFCGRRFKVTPDVLIPRPETAELVDWICQDAQSHDVSSQGASAQKVSVLDIGTGTGCIALTLAQVINNAQVLAIDLSTAALDVARQNSCQQGVDNVYFAQCDILNTVDNSYFEAQIDQELTAYQQHNPTINPQELFRCYPQQERVFNIIVSNPPYICQQEQKEMSSVVLDHEPSIALFVPDDDPLLFYRTIARFAQTHLIPGGRLYFEINAAYGAETCEMLRRMGYQDVVLRQDIHGRDRMVRASYITADVR